MHSISQSLTPILSRGQSECGRRNLDQPGEVDPHLCETGRQVDVGARELRTGCHGQLGACNEEDSRRLLGVDRERRFKKYLN